MVFTAPAWVRYEGVDFPGTRRGRPCIRGVNVVGRGLPALPTVRDGVLTDEGQTMAELDQEYERVLEDGRESGDLLEQSEDADRRRHPRIRVNPNNLPVEIDPWVFAIDISISGMAFYSDDPVPPGNLVTIKLADDIQAEAKVVGVQEEPPIGPEQSSRYRLQCEFTDEEQGKRLLVRIKEMEAVPESEP